MRKRATLILLSAMALLGCAGVHEPDDVSARLDDAVGRAEFYLKRGNQRAAAQFLGTVLRIDERHEKALAMYEALPPETTEHLFHKSALGSNHARRPLVRRHPVSRVFLYLPDRLLDLADIFSFDVHVAGGAYANLHLTRAAQFGLGGRSTAGLGWHDHRSLGTLVQSESEATLPGVGAQAAVGLAAGTSGVQSFRDADAGVRGPSDELYQEYRDYWAVGVAATAGLAGVDFDFHPVELADFLVGFSTFDFLHDDFARTAMLGLSRHDEKFLFRLAEIEASRESGENYRTARDDKG